MFVAFGIEMNCRESLDLYTSGLIRSAIYLSYYEVRYIFQVLSNLLPDRGKHLTILAPRSIKFNQDVIVIVNN
jgi:hypothetical protein